METYEVLDHVPHILVSDDLLLQFQQTLVSVEYNLLLAEVG